MKTVFQTKLLQHMIQKKKADEGFTLIELLVVIIIIGILAAIALPSFLNQANKAKESEAKQYTGSMNRTQQAYYLENTQFTTDISLLGLGIKTDSSNYTYSISGVTTTDVKNVSFPKNVDVLRAFTGAVQVAKIGATATTQETTTLPILCQSNRPAAGNAGGATTTANGQPGCLADWKDLGK